MANSGQFRKGATYSIVTIYFVFIILSAFILCEIENLTFIDSLYFIMVTTSTVGYGDIEPQSEYGKILVLIFIFLSFTLLSVFLHIIFDNWFDSKIDQLCNEMEQKLFHLNSKSNKQRHDIDTLILYTMLYILWCLVWIMFFTSSYSTNSLSLFDSFYFAIITSTTIGYSSFITDLDHQNGNIDKLFVFLWINIGVITFAILSSKLSKIIFNFLNNKYHVIINSKMDNYDRYNEQKQKLNQLFTKKSHNKQMTMHQFILKNLLEQQKIDENDINELKVLYNKLDTDHDGILSYDDFDGDKTINFAKSDNSKKLH